jgi:cyclase
MKIPTLVATAAAFGMAITIAAVQGQLVRGQAQAPAPAPPALTVNTVKAGSIYWIGGGGGNSGVVIGPDGVIVIDAKTTPAAAEQLIAEVAKLTPKPITHVIVTHSDGDHINGLPAFPASVKIIAHTNNKREQQMTFVTAAVEVGGGRCLPPAERLPNMLVTRERVPIKLSGVNFVLHHFGPAHTSGDLVVYLPDDKVVFAGDLLTSTVLIHPEKNGSFDGWFTTARGLLALDSETYIGGHAPKPDTKATLQTRIAGYQATKDKINGLIKEGKSLAEMKAAMGDPEKNPSGCRGIPYLSLTEIEYITQVNRSQEIKQ